MYRDDVLGIWYLALVKRDIQMLGINVLDLIVMKNGYEDIYAKPTDSPLSLLRVHTLTIAKGQFLIVWI